MKDFLNVYPLGEETTTMNFRHERKKKKVEGEKKTNKTRRELEDEFYIILNKTTQVAITNKKNIAFLFHFILPIFCCAYHASLKSTYTL